MQCELCKYQEALLVGGVCNKVELLCILASRNERPFRISDLTGIPHEILPCDESGTRAEICVFFDQTVPESKRSMLYSLPPKQAGLNEASLPLL